VLVPGPPTCKDDDIFAVTAKANRELKSSDTSLSATELQVLVLVDGLSTVKELAQRVPNIPRKDVDATLHKLMAGKLIVSTTDTDAMGSGFSTIAVPVGFFSGIDSSPEADAGVSILKQKGYYVRIARRPAQARDAAKGGRPVLLVIDDDEDLQRLIKLYFKMEGFATRQVLDGAGIAGALREPQVPEAILLDVHLPDANGFDILARMRQHPVLKSIPVVMLTAEATREAVLKGLQGGADGYVTKPFEQEQLIGAVKAVLGVLPPKEKKQ
jgi:DNA-binding response OmpR family regulator